MWPPDGPPLRDAAALLLLYPADGDWWLPLTVRASTLPHHTGQVSLPGGRLDPGETIEQAALREAHEEVGLPAAEVTVLGQLTPLPIPVSGHLLHPVVGVAASRPRFNAGGGGSGPADRSQPVAPARAGDGAAGSSGSANVPPGGMMDVPYFHVDGAQVWGATAMVLAEMLAVLAEVKAATTPL